LPGGEIPPTQPKTGFKATSSGLSAADLLRPGGAKVITPAATSQIQSDFAEVVISSSGSAATSEMGVRFPTPRSSLDVEGDTLPGGGTAPVGSNLASTPAGKNSGFPDASGGDGSGRKSKTVIGRTSGMNRPAGYQSAPLPGFTGQRGGRG
jgi:hypothetical protein